MTKAIQNEAKKEILSINNWSDKKEEEYIKFTQDMKQTHTILVPTMLPIHFRFMVNILKSYGYKAELIDNHSNTIIQEGLRNVHNDTCYPALLVIGQLIDALRSSKYDLSKVALLITQTGGGCRASNYIYLLRKALKNSGFGQVPVISLNFSGFEEDQAFKITLPMIRKIVNAIIVSDVLMCVSNQTKAYEINNGDTDELIDKWINRISDNNQSRALVNFNALKKDVKLILEDFAKIYRSNEPKIKVGIVGEIYIKYSPVGNNNLEDFLLNENCEVVIPAFLDFCLYCLNDALIENKLYGGSFIKKIIYKMLYYNFTKKQKIIINLFKKQGIFNAPSSFCYTKKLINGYVNEGMNMGEGWLLTAEMLELINSGVNNIICTQPFGCLPNHIVGRGMMKIIKEKNPQSNIVSIDYDPGATKVNQENRIKLMLANAKI
ncbi:2-hydroxyacyl-CoA dehydratase [Helicobacter sp. MIT 14-3879]|uniref:2-hydroxyacyl-CoA dehydratase n=1 Tax=Helicobacter sp. MIT 14-3879 TaxID=2040649 RepID=UPI000E1FA56B|nr:2-hydroxyacyl-CoA dehydratase [Helicobacter sp. MIT 14-3879]RDU65099.1 2-hydroxyglutaryl-CoA dehydratase [Helicobacter sp. MIT 14-3879]